MLFDAVGSRWRTGDIDGTRSQMTLIETRIGTDNKAPGTPQSQVQKINETKIDRKSTRLNSSHLGISYAVFCLKKKINNLLTENTRFLKSLRREQHCASDSR